MERPPKKYVCEKCGYFGDTSEHEGCNYLAWTTCEQLYIDQLEAELTSLRASPASVPEGWKIVPVEPTGEMVDAGIRSLGTADKFRAMLAAAPTPPSTEDRKDAERFRFLQEDHAMTTSLDTIRYHSGIAGEEVADMVDELEAKVEKLTKERDEWKNDVINGGNAGYLREQLAALAEQNEKMREALELANGHLLGYLYNYGGSGVHQFLLDTLSRPISQLLLLNQIKGNK